MHTFSIAEKILGGNQIHPSTLNPVYPGLRQIPKKLAVQADRIQAPRLPGPMLTLAPHAVLA